MESNMVLFPSIRDSIEVRGPFGQILVLFNSIPYSLLKTEERKVDNKKENEEVGAENFGFILDIL